MAALPQVRSTPAPQGLSDSTSAAVSRLPESVGLQDSSTARSDVTTALHGTIHAFGVHHKANGFVLLHLSLMQRVHMDQVDRRNPHNSSVWVENKIIPLVAQLSCQRSGDAEPQEQQRIEAVMKHFWQSWRSKAFHFMGDLALASDEATIAGAVHYWSRVLNQYTDSAGEAAAAGAAAVAAPSSRARSHSITNAFKLMTAEFRTALEEQYPLVQDRRMQLQRLWNGNISAAKFVSSVKLVAQARRASALAAAEQQASDALALASVRGATASAGKDTAEAKYPTASAHAAGSVAASAAAAATSKASTLSMLFSEMFADSQPLSQYNQEISIDSDSIPHPRRALPLPRMRLLHAAAQQLLQR